VSAFPTIRRERLDVDAAVRQRRQPGDGAALDREAGVAVPVGTEDGDQSVVVDGSRRRGVDRVPDPGDVPKSVGVALSGHSTAVALPVANDIAEPTASALPLIASGAELELAFARSPGRPRGSSFVVPARRGKPSCTLAPFSAAMPKTAPFLLMPNSSVPALPTIVSLYCGAAVAARGRGEARPGERCRRGNHAQSRHDTGLGEATRARSPSGGQDCSARGPQTYTGHGCSLRISSCRWACTRPCAAISTSSCGS
jgi:hypothetical protein